MSRVGQCSEFMMVPGNLLTKGARYAENLESWFSEFPREQLLVIHTDDLTTSTQVSPSLAATPTLTLTLTTRTRTRTRTRTLTRA